MKAPLPQKKQGRQKAFTAPPQVVVNHKSGAQHYPDEVQDRVGEVAGIGSDDHHRIGKEDDGQHQHRNSQDTLLGIGGG